MPPERTLTNSDLEAIAEMLRCNSCSFTAEEVQFVKGWLETAKTAKSEVVKFVVKSIFIVFGLMCGLWVAIKMDAFKVLGK